MENRNLLSIYSEQEVLFFGVGRGLGKSVDEAVVEMT